MWADSQWVKGGKKDAKKPKTSNTYGDTTFEWTANVTQYTLTVHHASASQPDPHEWTIDSASNANLTPFKDRLEHYQEFDNSGTVKGLGGKRVSAYGKGSINVFNRECLSWLVRHRLIPGECLPVYWLRPPDCLDDSCERSGVTLSGEVCVMPVISLNVSMVV